MGTINTVLATYLTLSDVFHTRLTSDPFVVHSARCGGHHGPLQRADVLLDAGPGCEGVWPTPGLRVWALAKGMSFTFSMSKLCLSYTWSNFYRCVCRCASWIFHLGLALAWRFRPTCGRRTTAPRLPGVCYNHLIVFTCLFDDITYFNLFFLGGINFFRAPLLRCS